MIVVYKIDRLTRLLTDLAKLAEAFDARSESFSSLSFARFEAPHRQGSICAFTAAI